MENDSAFGYHSSIVALQPTNQTMFSLALATATALVSAEGPCDIYDKAGTPCVAAHSMTRALYGAYAGPLYSVKYGL